MRAQACGYIPRRQNTKRRLDSLLLTDKRGLPLTFFSMFCKWCGGIVVVLKTHRDDLDDFLLLIEVRCDLRKISFRELWWSDNIPVFDSNFQTCLQDVIIDVTAHVMATDNL
jgi:hypothetical protein